MEADGNPFYLYSAKFKLIARARMLPDMPMFVFSVVHVIKKQRPHNR